METPQEILRGNWWKKPPLATGQLKVMACDQNQGLIFGLLLNSLQKKRSEMKWLASKLSRSGTFSTKYHSTNSKISIYSILCKLSWNTLAYVRLCCKNKDKNKTINKEEMFSDSKFEQHCLSKIPGSASTYLAIVHPSGMASRGHLHVQSHKAVR